MPPDKKAAQAQINAALKHMLNNNTPPSSVRSYTSTPNVSTRSMTGARNQRKGQHEDENRSEPPTEQRKTSVVHSRERDELQATLTHPPVPTRHDLPETQPEQPIETRKTKAKPSKISTAGAKPAHHTVAEEDGHTGQMAWYKQFLRSVANGLEPVRVVISWLASWMLWIVVWMLIAVTAIVGTAILMWFFSSFVWWLGNELATGMWSFLGQLICESPVVGTALSATGMVCQVGAASTLRDWKFWRMGETIVCKAPWASTVLRNANIGCLDSEPAAVIMTTSRQDAQNDFKVLHQSVSRLHDDLVQLLPHSNLLLSTQLQIISTANNVALLDIQTANYTSELYFALADSYDEAGKCAGAVVFNITDFMDILSRSLAYLEHQAEDYEAKWYILRLLQPSHEHTLTAELNRYLSGLNRHFIGLELKTRMCFLHFQAVERRLEYVRQQQVFNLKIVDANLRSWRARRPFSSFSQEQRKIRTVLEHQVKVEYLTSFNRTLTLATQLHDLRQLTNKVQSATQLYHGLFAPFVLRHGDMNATAARIAQTVKNIQKFTAIAYAH